MTNYLKIRNTIMTNPKGIIDSVMSFGLQGKMFTNVRMYFYKYNIYDLIEIEYMNGCVRVYDFPHTNNRAELIEKNLEFYMGYFDSAGLSNKRFLFDITTKLPVNYEDFVEMDKIPNIHNKDFAFTLDKKSGYVCEKSAVFAFVASDRTDVIDKCVLSFMNDSIGVIDNKNFDLSGCCASMIISGLLSGLKFSDIQDQNEIIDAETKYIGAIRDVDISSKYVNDIRSKLKIDKFRRILEKSKPDDIIQGEVVSQQLLKGEVSLREIIDQGLDKFMKTVEKQVKSNKDVLKVHIDTEYQTIRSAYIVKGAMLITPIPLLPISYFKDLLNSDNVEYVIN